MHKILFEHENEIQKSKITINGKGDYALLARCIKLFDFLLLTAAKSTAALKYLVGAVEQ